MSDWPLRSSGHVPRYSSIDRLSGGSRSNQDHRNRVAYNCVDHRHWRSLNLWIVEKATAETADLKCRFGLLEIWESKITNH